MKKIISLIILVIFPNLILTAQNAGRLLTLDNYTIPLNKEGAIIGTFSAEPTDGKIKLSKDTSRLFMIKNESISLKKGKCLTEKSPDRFEIEVVTRNGKKKIELVKNNFITNKIIAHRGAWKNHDASQNSMNALKCAIEIGCEAVEFDVWLSADNKVILSHDPTIGGKTVELTSSDELTKIPLKNGDFVPILEEYIEYIKTQNRTRLVLEIKGSQQGEERCQALVDSAVHIVHRLKAQAWVDYISFDYNALLRIRELDPTAAIAYLDQDKKTLEELKADDITGIDYHFSGFDKDDQLVDKSHQNGLTTNAWTVNDPDKAKHLLEKGIDYITTDEPELLLKLVKKEYK